MRQIVTKVRIGIKRIEPKQIAHHHAALRTLFSHPPRSGAKAASFASPHLFCGWGRLRRQIRRRQPGRHSVPA
ncbi:MAG TPA: hypothetical protein VGN34_01080 [Ktedonobacteraceae bacterium]